MTTTGKPLQNNRAWKYGMIRRTVTHFVSAMGTTGTIMGTSTSERENPDIQINGAQPSDGSQIPGIRKWLWNIYPKIFNPAKVDRIIEVSEQEAQSMTKRLALEEGVLQE
jgi:cysteine synthase B